MGQTCDHTLTERRRRLTKLFEDPLIEATTFAAEDIMTASANEGEHDNTYTDFGDLAAWVAGLKK